VDFTIKKIRQALRNRFNSIRFKLMFGLLVVMLPIISLLVYNNFYSMKVVRNQVALSNSNLISMYMGQIDRNLEDIDKYLLAFITSDTGLMTMARDYNENINQYNLTKVRLFNTLAEESAYLNSLQYFFIYSSKNRDFMIVPRDAKEEYQVYTEKQLIRNQFIRTLRDEQQSSGFSPRSWTTVQINHEYFLNRIIKLGDIYVGALVKVKNIIVPLNYLDIGENGKSMLVNEQGEPMYDIDFIMNNGIMPSYDRNSYGFTGKHNQYLIVGEKSGKGNFSLIALIPDRNILEKLPRLQRIILFLAWGLVLYLAVALLVLRRVVLAPINRIVVEMRKLKQGFLGARISHLPTSNEFELMNETFNTMASDIQQLKIDIYEEQLNSQKAELKHLQLQINPHFFLNSLNIVYYLARDRNYSLIQDLSLSLIQYFRFMFRSHSDFVLLQDEIKHTRNYLRIQEFRFPGSLTYRIESADTLLNYRVPPLIIQTFVENSIKYAMNLDESVHIEIRVDKDEQDSGSGIKISVHDNGKGFDAPILQQLQEDRNPVNEAGEQVGIWNVRRRLRLLYQERASITFINDCGASVHIRIPD